MLNNKGFAVSTVLYTLLIAFLLFLGATLAMFSSSTSVVGNANTDLSDGSKLVATQVKLSDSQNTCVAVKEPVNGVIPSSSPNHYWYETGTLENGIITNAIILKINSKYGTLYWPKDFATAFNATTGAIATSEGNGVTKNDGDGLNLIESTITGRKIDEEAGTVYKNIKVQCSVGNVYTNPEKCNINWPVSTEPGRLDILRLRIVDTITNEDFYVSLYDLCQ